VAAQFEYGPALSGSLLISFSIRVLSSLNESRCSVASSRPEVLYRYWLA
jgi:hypothetical protein